MRPGAPSPAVNGSKEIGLFVAVMGSLYLRPQYNKPLALVKNLLLPSLPSIVQKAALW